MNEKKEPIPADGAEKTTEHSPSEEKKAEKLLQPGGRVFSLMFLAFGLVFFIQSVQLFQKNASISGYATFPLIVSALLLILTVIDYIQNLKIKSEIAELYNAKNLESTLFHLSTGHPYIPANEHFLLPPSFVRGALYRCIANISDGDNELPDPAPVSEKYRVRRDFDGCNLRHIRPGVQSDFTIGGVEWKFYPIY